MLFVFVGLIITNVSKSFSNGVYLVIVALLLEFIASAFTARFGSGNTEDANQWLEYCPVCPPSIEADFRSPS